MKSLTNYRSSSCHKVEQTGLNAKSIYNIRPNCRTVHLELSKLLGKLVVKLVSTYTQVTLKKRSAKDLCNDAYAMFLCVFLFFSFSGFLYKSYGHYAFLKK